MTPDPQSIQEKVEPVLEIQQAPVGVMKKLIDCLPGTRVRISVAEVLRSGATVSSPLEGIVITNALRGNNSYPCVAWTKEEHALKGVDIEEGVSDLNFPELTKGCHFWENTQAEVLAEAPPVEEKKEPSKRLLQDCKPGDRVRVMPADAAATTGNGWFWPQIKEPLEATVITYEGKDRYYGCMIVAWDPELAPNEIRHNASFKETAFPKLTRGLFIMPETPCELIAAAANEATPSPEMPPAEAASQKSNLDAFLEAIKNIEQQMGKIAAETQQEVGKLEELFPPPMSEEDEKLAQSIVSVLDKIAARFDQIEEKERAGKLNGKSALEEMNKLVQALEDGLKKTEPNEQAAKPRTFFVDHSQPLHLPKDKKKSDKTGFLLACAAAGVGLSGLAASTLPATTVNKPKKSRKKAGKSTNAT
jgi:hypothetical protein